MDVKLGDCCLAHLKVTKNQWSLDSDVDNMLHTVEIKHEYLDSGQIWITTGEEEEELDESDKHIGILSTRS